MQMSSFDLCQTGVTSYETYVGKYITNTALGYTITTLNNNDQKLLRFKYAAALFHVYSRLDRFFTAAIFFIGPLLGSIIRWSSGILLKTRNSF